MKNLIQIEWMKLKRLVTMKVILLVYMVAVPTMYLLMSLLEVGPIRLPTAAYQFPDSYQLVCWTASWFNLMVGVIIVVYTTNELKYKTQRQNVIDGLSKKDIILSKFYVILGLSAFVTIYTALVGLVIGLLHGSENSIFDGLEYIAVYFVSTLGYFSFAFFFANLVRLPALAIIIYIFSTIIEGIIGLIVANKYVELFPLTTFSKLTPFPLKYWVAPSENALLSTPQATGLAAIYISLFVLISYWVIKNRDI